MRRAARREHRNGATSVSSSTRRNVSSSSSRKGVEWPAAALLTSASNPPSASASSSMTASAPEPSEKSARRAAEQRGAPFLVYRDAQGEQRVVPLEVRSGAVTVGRRLEADISLPWDPEVSRLHAELALRAGEWTICDDGWSQNGTWVNELRLTGRRRLTDDDTIRVGRTEITFRRPVGTVSIPTLVPGELSA